MQHGKHNCMNCKMLKVGNSEKVWMDANRHNVRMRPLAPQEVFSGCLLYHCGILKIWGPVDMWACRYPCSSVTLESHEESRRKKTINPMSCNAHAYRYSQVSLAWLEHSCIHMALTPLLVSVDMVANNMHAQWTSTNSV
jgi:hypothetical protein